MKTSWETLHQLIENKLCQAGLKREHAATVAEVLVYADAGGIHPHSVIRVEYYTERISKGGTNREPEFRLEEIGPCSAILHADNAAGQVTVKIGMEHATKVAQQRGVTVVGISRADHSGAISYSMQQATRAGLIDISLYQLDPMVVPLGGAEIYYDTSPLAFAAPGEGDEIFTLDMVTTIQAWGKVLDACSRNMPIPDTWAVDKSGAPTTDPPAVHVLLPATGSKGYGPTMMIDVLSDALFGLPFERQVSSVYDGLHTGCNLEQLYIIINPNFLSSSKLFHQHLSQTMRELNIITPAPDLSQVYYLGQGQGIKQRKAAVEGIETVDDIYRYLTSDALHNISYETKNPFA